MRRSTLILTGLMVALGSSAAVGVAQSQCLPTEPAHTQGPPEFWEWHHDLVAPPACDGFVFLAGGEAVLDPFSDKVNLTTRDWHVEVRTDPPNLDICFNVFGTIYCTDGAVGPFHLAVPEPVGMETGNWIARWVNNATDPTVEIGIDSSVAEQGTGDLMIPPHDDTDLVIVAEVPDNAVVLEFVWEGPTPTHSSSWGRIKSNNRPR